LAKIELKAELLPSLSTEKRQEEFYDKNYSSRGSFGIRINAGGRKSFFLIYPIGSKRRRMNLGLYPNLSLEEAKAKAIQISALVEKGKDPAVEAKSLNTIQTFSQLVSEFDSEHISKKCSLSTQGEYRRILNKELLPIWGARLCSSITSSDVEIVVKSIGGVRKSPTMANRVKSLCSKLFSFACQKAIIAENPVSNIKNFPTTPEFERALSMDEARRLWKHLDYEDPIKASALKMILLTGQLPSRVLSMKWKDIQLDSWHVGGKQEQSIHLSPPAIQVLKQLKNSKAEYVFQSKKGKPISHLRHLCKRINIDLTLETIWRPIDLRKTVAVEMKKLGIGLDVIARVLNQKSLVQRLSTDPKSLDAQAEKALAKWARHLMPKASRKPQANSKIIPLFPA